MLSQTNSHTPSEGDAGANGKTLCKGNTTTKRARTASFPHQGHSAPDRKKIFFAVRQQTHIYQQIIIEQVQTIKEVNN